MSGGFIIQLRQITGAGILSYYNNGTNTIWKMPDHNLTDELFIRCHGEELMRILSLVGFEHTTKVVISRWFYVIRCMILWASFFHFLTYQFLYIKLKLINVRVNENCT